MRNRYTRAAFAILFTLVLASCTNNVKVHSHSASKEGSFASLSTYSWGNSGKIKNIAQGGSSEHSHDRMIRGMIDNTLASYGYTRVNDGSADFTVEYQYALTSEAVYSDRGYGTTQNDQALDHEYGFKWRLGGKGEDSGYQGMSPPEEQIITLLKSKLDVAVFSSSSQLLWHQSAEKLIDRKDTSDDMRSSLAEEVSSIMANFPNRNEKEKD